MVATKHDHSSHSNRQESVFLRASSRLQALFIWTCQKCIVFPQVGEIERENGIRVIFQHAGALYSLLYVTTALSSNKLSIP